MAYGKQRFRRTRQRRYKRRYLSRRPTRNFARKVKKTLFRISETKQLSYSLTGTLSTLASTGINYYGAPPIAQGAGDTNRIGNTIWAKRMTWNIKLTMTTGTTDGVRDVVIYVVSPRQASNGDATQLITYTNFPVYDLHDQDSFHIHRIIRFTMTNQDASGGKYSAVTDKWINVSIPVNRKYIFSSSQDTSPEKQTYLIISTASVGSNIGAISIAGYGKLSWKDI